MKKLLTFFIVTIWPGISFAGSSTYDAVMEGKKCTERPDQTISCTYKVGKSVDISIDGIGNPDIGVTFLKSDFDGDFYVKYGVGHGCIIVNAGMSNPIPGMIFIQPKNGKVYKTWQDCKAGY